MDETIDTFEHVKEDKPDPELEELDGKVHVGDDEIIGLADAVFTSVSEKLTWLPLGPLHWCRQKIRKENFKLVQKDDIWQFWQWPGQKVDLLDDFKVDLKALDDNKWIIKDTLTLDTFDTAQYKIEI